MDCPYCSGRGTVAVNGHDFGEIYSATCPCCKGTKTFSPYEAAQRLVRAEQDRDRDFAALRELRVQVALYLHYKPLRERLGSIPIDDPTREAQIQAANPGLRDAPNPSPWVETWLEYLEAAARLAVRK